MTTPKKTKGLNAAQRQRLYDFTDSTGSLQNALAAVHATRMSLKDHGSTDDLIRSLDTVERALFALLTLTREHVKALNSIQERSAS